jgi:hypothetical protein
MTYTLIWRDEARQALSRLRSADPASGTCTTSSGPRCSLPSHPTRTHSRSDTVNDPTTEIGSRAAEGATSDLTEAP